MDRGRFTAVLDDGGASIYAVKARELGRKSVVVGDAVWLTGDRRGGPDRLARIVRIEERSTVLRRSADDDDPDERVLVANADQLAIVTSLADPEPSPGLIDRCLVAAYDAGLRPLLVLTKADLADPAPLLALYEALDVPTAVCAIDVQPAVGADGPDDQAGTGPDATRTGPDETRTGRAEAGTGPDGPPDGAETSPVLLAGAAVDPASLAELREHLVDCVTCLVGHSGVGKSTLVNALLPDAGRSTGAVNAVTGRGRHTSSQAVAIPLPEGGWLVDTPGVRSFGLAYVEPDRVLHAFPEFDDALAECPRGCPHTQGAQDCALDEFADSGRAGDAGPARLASLRRLLATRPTEPGA